MAHQVTGLKQMLLPDPLSLTPRAGLSSDPHRPAYPHAECGPEVASICNTSPELCMLQSLLFFRDQLKPQVSLIALGNSLFYSSVYGLP